MMPPYARAIVNERRAGRHPELVIIGVSDQWMRGTDPLYPFVFVLEDDYLAGKYEFWWLAGLAVQLECHCREADTWPHLAGTLAQHTAPVIVRHSVHYPAGEDVAEVMRDIAYGRLWPEADWCGFEASNVPWPRWWSWARDERYAAELAAWSACRTRRFA